jgi:hypothetical protein
MTGTAAAQLSADRPHRPGFEPVHKDERARLKLNHDARALDGVGLALSGGGIRSASFALGVVQALMNNDLLKRFDYLSTVSGGGYLGSAVSWWLDRAVEDPALGQVPPQKRYEAFREQFGSKVLGARPNSDPHLKRPPGDWGKSNWLAYIRQHGNYLRPPGVSVLSLAASVLRVCFYSLSVYISAAIGVFCLIAWLSDRGLNLYTVFGEYLAIAVAGLFVLMALAYGPATWLASKDWLVPAPSLYKGRTSFRRMSGSLLAVALGALVFWSIPLLDQFLARHAATWWASASASGLGTVGSVYQFWRGRAHTPQPSLLARLRLVVTAALVAYGLLLAAYLVAHCHLLATDPGIAGLVALGLSALFGLYVNTNYSGIARLYRDRLMEAFLPDTHSVAENHWGLATTADLFAVASLAGHLTPTGALRKVSGETDCQRPLHLVNCNVVLVDSQRDIFRTRGGDSFFISNRWSGSDATGWVETRQLGDGAVSLATAMSISGAAANPNAAPNGRGVTRNRLVAFLMSLFNARLGYWMANPSIGPRNLANRPNFWLPGFRQGLLGRGLHENARFLELTDGGHFDNTGIYELVRRRTQLIVLCEAGHDPKFTMDDLANAIEKVRVDFSVFIEFNDPKFDLSGLRPHRGAPTRAVERGFALGRIRYPKGEPTSPDFDEGLLVYLQAVPVGAMPAEVDSFWRRHTTFPNDTTADQFFDEEQLEAYRELGYTIASQFCKSIMPVMAADSSYLSRVAAILLARGSRTDDTAAPGDDVPRHPRNAS